MLDCCFAHAKLMKEKFDADLYLLYNLPGPEQYKGLELENDWFVSCGHSLERGVEGALKNFIKRNMQGFEPKKADIRIGEIIGPTAINPVSGRGV